MKKKFILAQEFIGKWIEITQSDCKSQIGLCGKIVDETRNTFIIKTSKGTKRLIKSQLRFRLDGHQIKGADVAKRPEERLKMRIQNE